MEIMKFEKDTLQEHYASCLLLKDLIQRIEDDLWPNGKVICRIKVNGLALSENDEGRFAQTNLAEIQNLEIEAEEVSVLARASIQTLLVFIVNLRDECIRVSESFRSGDDHKALQMFTKIMGNSEYLIEALSVLKPNLESIKAVTDWQEKWKTTEVHMVHTLNELVQACEAKDYTLLSDVLEYELYNTLDKWREQLSSFS